MIKQLHHVGVLTGNIEAASAHYQRLLRAPPPRITHVARAEFSCGPRWWRSVRGADRSCSFVQPEVGPGVAEAEQRGDGALYEIALEVDDIGAVASAFRATGLTSCDIAGTPIEQPYLVVASVQTGGSQMEFIQVIPKTEEGRW